MDGKPRRSGHFIKKKSKDKKKIPPNEPIPMNEQEHDDMLKVAKVIFLHLRHVIHLFIFNRNSNYLTKMKLMN